MTKLAPRAAMALAAAVTFDLGLLLSACSSPKTTTPQQVSQADIDKAMKTPTTITFWTANKLQPEIDLFEKKYPAIKVNLVDAGSGNNYYTKLRSALKAGKGAPDVAQIEYHHMPSFVLGKNLVNLTPYGAGDVAPRFEKFAWDQVATVTGIYGIPQDTGPLGLLYRSDIFSAAGIACPTTWDEFAKDATIIHAADGGPYIANISPSNASATLGLFWQAGARPFSYDGNKTVSVKLDSPEMVKVAEYWQALVQAGTVSTDPDFTDQWYRGLARGKYASWVSAAWGPLFLQGTAADTAGKWTAAELPQWKAGEHMSGAVGGSANVVLATSEHPIPSAKFIEFINSDPDSTLIMGTQQFLFPAATATLKNAAFTDQPVKFFAGQQINKLFAAISPTVNANFPWLPFMDPVFESYNSTFGKALTEKTSLVAALKAWQDAVVTYAKGQGFTVN